MDVEGDRETATGPPAPRRPPYELATARAAGGEAPAALHCELLGALLPTEKLYLDRKSM